MLRRHIVSPPRIRREYRFFVYGAGAGALLQTPPSVKALFTAERLLDIFAILHRGGV